MIRTTRISHSVFETPDLNRQVDYYSNVMGFHVSAKSSKQAFLHGPTGQETIAFELGDTNRCRRVAFQAAPEFDGVRIAQELQKLGIKSEQRSDVSPSISRAVSFVDPKGTEIELFSECTDAAIPKTRGGIGPLKLGHIAFSVSSAKSMCDFYESALGFRVSDWIEDMFVFMRCGPDHHTVNFLTGESTFMHHIAYELRDWSHVLKACDVLGQEKRPIIWGPGRHRVGHNIFVYHRDPDDNIIEFYTELDLMKDEELGFFEPRPWHKTNPQRPAVWSRPDSAPVWGLAPSPDFRRNGNDHLNASK